MDRALDAAIDEVCRDMTAGEPAAGFRRRVLTGVARRERAAWLRGALVPAGAVAAVLLVAVIGWHLTRTSPAQPGTTPQPSLIASRQIRDAVPLPGVSAGRANESIVQRPRTMSRPRAQRPRPLPILSAAEIAAWQRALQPPPIDQPIVIEPLPAPQVEPVTPLTLPPLEIEEIVVPPTKVDPLPPPGPIPPRDR